jgi:hypothetical protein
MADQAWLEAFKAEHGWYPWEDPNLAAKGFSPEDAYAEHLVAKSISEKPKAPTFVKSWQQRYGMTDQEHPYLKPAAIPDMPTPASVQAAIQAAQGGRYGPSAPPLSPEQMASPEYRGMPSGMGTPASSYMTPDMSNDAGPGYVPGMQEGMGVSAMPGSRYKGTPTPMFEEPVSFERSAMDSASTGAPAWASQSNKAMELFATLPPEMQEDIYSSLKQGRQVSPVTTEALTLLTNRTGISRGQFAAMLMEGLGVK